jgi:cyclic pyranopterin phosphate synthase
MSKTPRDRPHDVRADDWPKPGDRLSANPDAPAPRKLHSRFLTATPRRFPRRRIHDLDTGLFRAFQPQVLAHDSVNSIPSFAALPSFWPTPRPPATLPAVSPSLSHLDERGEARMVDVSAKPAVLREALATGEIRLAPATLDLIEAQTIAKGNVLATARLAGILAAKKTGELIPLCHPLPLTHCSVDFVIPPTRDRIGITASARIVAPTGIEMEALTAVSVAALTIYDMCKAVDKTMVIGDIRLLRKTKAPAA